MSHVLPVAEVQQSAASEPAKQSLAAAAYLQPSIQPDAAAPVSAPQDAPASSPATASGGETATGADTIAQQVGVVLGRVRDGL